MDGRGAFLTMAPDRREETSVAQGQLEYSCNNCKSHVKECYQCDLCGQLYLCVPCHDKSGHQHKMIKVGVNLTGKSVPGNAKKLSPQEERDRVANHTIWALMHACQCNTNCGQASCEKMKRVVKHTKTCKRQATGGCNICKQLVALCCKHAKTCTNMNCKVPLCNNIKWQMEEQLNEKVHLLMHRLEQKRMAVMDECGYLLKDEDFEPRPLPIPRRAPPDAAPLRPPPGLEPVPPPALEPAPAAVPPQPAPAFLPPQPAPAVLPRQPAPAPASPQPAPAPASPQPASAPASPQPVPAPPSPQPAPAPASPSPAEPTAHAHAHDGHE